MKLLSGLLFLLMVMTSFKPSPVSVTECYSPDYVEISSVPYKNESYKIVLMRRSGERVKAKYFAAKDYDGRNVFDRFSEWKKNNNNIILLSSGTYMDDSQTPQGLTIDNGVMVNQSLINNKMDALVIVYASGGIVVSNLVDGDLSVTGRTIASGRKLNLRKSSNDLIDFIDWAKEEDATVFQTHLLVYKNEIKINPYNSSPTKRERRFLAVGKDENGKVVHVVVHYPSFATLYDATKNTLDFLKTMKELNITFMINLDTGVQDVFELHNSDCTINKTIKGQKDPTAAVNLLAYYFN